MDLALLTKAALISGAVALGLGIKYMTNSRIEIAVVDKIAEEVLEKETGIDVDFATDTIKQ